MTQTNSKASNWANLPAWAQWAGIAAAGVLLLSAVSSFTGTTLLTSSDLISTTLLWSMPILLAGIGGLFAERAGVVNIGLEGMMIMGTWMGAWGALVTHSPWGGLVIGTVGGALGGLLHAIATVQFGVDQIVSGVAINILGLGLPRYLSENVFVNMKGGSATQSPHVDDLGTFSIPVLAGGAGTSDMLGNLEDRGWFFASNLAGVLRGFMIDVSYFTLIGLLLVPLASFVLYKTRFGLRVRISGERPSAGDSLGGGIYFYKYMGVIISGALAGMAGAFIVMELAGLYKEGQTLGRGFIALAALIFGNWKARGILGGALLFAYPDGLKLIDLETTSVRALLLVIAIVLFGIAIWSFKQDDRANSIIALTIASICAIWFSQTTEAAKWLPGVMPYALVLLVLIFFGKRLRPPAAAGQPYHRDDH